METKELKEKLHTLIENSSENKLAHIYSFFETTNYKGDFKAMLDNEFAAYQTDKSGNTREEVNASVNALMSAE